MLNDLVWSLIESLHLERMTGIKFIDEVTAFDPKLSLTDRPITLYYLQKGYLLWSRIHPYFSQCRRNRLFERKFLYRLICHQ